MRHLDVVGGILVGVLGLMLILFFAVRCYEVGFEKGKQAQEMNHPTLGRLHWSVDDECLYIWRGEENGAWVKLCQPCEEDTP